MNTFYGGSHTHNYGGGGGSRGGGGGTAMAVLAIIGFVLLLKFWWIPVGLFGVWLAWQAVESVKAVQDSRREVLRQTAERADAQHRAYLNDNPYGTFGNYQP